MKWSGPTRVRVISVYTRVAEKTSHEALDAFAHVGPVRRRPPFVLCVRAERALFDGSFFMFSLF